MRKHLPINSQHALLRIIEQLSHCRPKWKVWSDFVECAAISLSNAVDLAQRAPREARYLQIIKGYPGDEAQALARALAHTVNELETGFCDCLGETFMTLELGSHWGGQYFTPYDVASLMARMTLGDPRPALQERGFMTVLEPAVGAGAMVIAIAQALHDAGISYQQQLHVTAVDVDLTAALMAYVQLSLLHIPAVVLHGNSLTRGAVYLVHASARHGRLVAKAARRRCVSRRADGTAGAARLPRQRDDCLAASRTATRPRRAAAFFLISPLRMSR